MQKEVYSICLMCSMRCPIKVIVENNQVTRIEGNPHAAGIEGRLCAKGAAGIGLLNDVERLQYPMIRSGPRGSNNWRKASWPEALEYISQKLKIIIDKEGARSIVFGERWNLSTHISRTFMNAIGSPNYFTHDSLCKGSMNTACRSLFGYTDEQIFMDHSNVRHMVIYGRNIFESLDMRAAKQLIDAMARGTKLTYIDPRVTITATKANRYWMIRPGTDLAVNYAMIHIILKENLYDHAYTERWVSGLKELKEFVGLYTPEWAEKISGIPAGEIIDLAREMSRDKPKVIFNFGFRATNYTDEVYFRRSIMILNALMGSMEIQGGLFFKKDPYEVGGQPPRELNNQKFPKINQLRFDRAGTPEFPLPDPRTGVAQMLPRAILDSNPYPIKAAIFYRFDPICSIMDSRQTIKALEKLELIVSIDINHSDTAAFSDVILPESTFLERTDSVFRVDGLIPQMFLRRQAVTPRYDTKPGPIILKELAQKMGIGHWFPYETMEELVDWQLSGTGFSITDFDDKGFVAYTDKPIFWERKNGLKFKTPSGKIEFISSMFKNAGIESFPKYHPMPSPPDGYFRLICGRSVFHCNVATQNNRYLNHALPENVLWINQNTADGLGVHDGDMVTVSSSKGAGRIKAFVTDMIHPETVFMLHGFGHQNPLAERSYGKGVSDALLQENATDKVGGSQALHCTFVKVRPN
jgi:thiosulfate reductase/polysulfide reductase chain A